MQSGIDDHSLAHITLDHHKSLWWYNQCETFNLASLPQTYTFFFQDLLRDGYLDIPTITLEITGLWAGKVLDGLY